MLLKAADGGNTNQVMECLNTENRNQPKKKKPAKPASLETANMQNPNGPKAANMQEENNTEAKAQKPTAGTGKAKEDDSDSSDIEFECLACSA